jgi:hypothetical protein
MELADLIDNVPGFDAATPGEKIRIFAWFLHQYRDKAVFKTADIRDCFLRLHIPVPNIAMYLSRMTESKPPRALREGDTYKLARTARTDLDASYGMHRSFVQVSKLLADLPNKVPDLAEKTFLVEAMDCYRVQAYRACIVMTWNLAFDHLLRWILKDVQRLSAFNFAITKRYPKRTGITIVEQANFEDFKESEILEICNTANLMSDNIIKILKEKLSKRNISAHPSTVVVVQSQADDVVTDLVNNVVIALR